MKQLSQILLVVLTVALTISCGNQGVVIEDDESEFLYATLPDGTEFSAWVSDVEPGEPTYFFIDLDSGKASYKINDGVWKEMELITGEDEDGRYSLFEAMENLPKGSYSVAFRVTPNGSSPSEFCCVQVTIP